MLAVLLTNANVLYVNQLFLKYNFSKRTRSSGCLESSTSSQGQPYLTGAGGEIDGGWLSGFLEVARAFSHLDPATGRKPMGLSGVPELSMQPLQPGDEFILIRATAAAATIASSPGAPRPSAPTPTPMPTLTPTLAPTLRPPPPPPPRHPPKTRRCQPRQPRAAGMLAQPAHTLGGLCLLAQL